MRLIRTDNQRGSITVLLFAAIPLMAAALLLVIDMGRIAVTRARLQAAVDRAAYAGAASLAHSLNTMAAENWNIHKAFRDLRAEFAQDTQKDRETAQQHIGEYEAKRDKAFSNIEATLLAMGDRAKEAAADTLFSNTSDLETEIEDLSVRGDIDLADDAKPEEQEESLDYGYVTGGGSFLDPEKVKEESYDAFKYRIKRTDPNVSLGIYATSEVTPLMLGVLAEDPVEVHAASAAEAFGGSLEEFAQKETDDLDEAEEETFDEGYDALYRSAIIPWGSW
ncbi:MAG: Tad domain-containing protein [Pseudomonadota bacterium]